MSLIYLYKNYYLNKDKNISKNIKNTLTLNLSQKKYNNKCTITQYKNLNTFSIGSILKYFKVKQGKYVRRSVKGLKIFLNFLKNFLNKKFLIKNLILVVSGFDYNLFVLKKNFKKFFLNLNFLFYFIFNIKISFNKTKDKKIKAIKKRLKKKIILNFIKANKVKK